MFEEVSPKPNKNLLKSSFIALSIIGSFYFAAYFISSANSSLIPFDFKYNLEIEEFRSFISRYNKDYKTEEEFYHRLKVFIDNLSYIRFFNSQGQTWYMGINQFSDLTHEEFSRAHKNKIIIPDQSVSDITEEFVAPNLQIPRSFDQRSYGCVSPIRNEGSCSAPWAYAAVGTIEGTWCDVGHGLTDLSVQQLIDCSDLYGNKGCNGGSIINAYNYVMKKGITSEQIYPTTGTQGVCNTAKEKQVLVSLASFARILANNSYAFEVGILSAPVAAYVEAIGAGWQNYKGGIISSNCGTDLDWAVLAVGYNLANSLPYYTCQNSWGTDWGEAGYVRISIVDGAGTCGIQMSASFGVY
ncbi:unnamed protein product [Blepharisma stoltei]|uniref:Uncharacterized protein n=1 Tax=Blepharisma stoltei TaxID=1481888 RepID=A0AAU9K192_9CILI|nr:unnamed protein product [Blepharisma stoltei]